MADSSDSEPVFGDASCRNGNESTAKSGMEVNILNAIAGLSEKISVQSTRMDEQENVLQEVAGRLNTFDALWAETAESESPVTDNFVGFADSRVPEGPEIMPSGSTVCLDDSGDNNGRRALPADVSEGSDAKFARLAEKFTHKEVCGLDLPPVLAATISDWFTKGLPENVYEEIINDKANARPANCEVLSVVKVNQMLWDAISPNARAVDVRLQKLLASVVTAGSILCKVLNKAGTLGQEDFSVSVRKELVEKCGTVLALLGQANKQINAQRKELLRSELSPEYKYLCNASTPVSKFLFGDDVAKTAKDIEECAKITNRMFGARSASGVMRSRMGRMARFRMGYAVARGRAVGRGSGSYGWDQNSDSSQP